MWNDMPVDLPHTHHTIEFETSMLSLAEGREEASKAPEVRLSLVACRWHVTASLSSNLHLQNVIIIPISGQSSNHGGLLPATDLFNVTPTPSQPMGASM
jgi:hypothetical protein